MRLRGLYLVKPHGSLIRGGTKSAVVKSRPFRMAYEPMVLVEGRHALGVVVLSEPIPIDLCTFRALFPLHRITEEERRSWWPGAQTLWLYHVASFRPFPKPLPVEVPAGVQTFISAVEVPEDHVGGEQHGPQEEGP